jgi:hypothetical protein
MTGVARPFSVPSVLFRPGPAVLSVGAWIISSSIGDVTDHIQVGTVRRQERLTAIESTLPEADG